MFLTDYAEALCVENISTQPRQTHHCNRTIVALEGLGTADSRGLASRIKGCRKGASCSSTWCRRCRHRAAKGLQQRMASHVDVAFGDNHELARQRLLFVTVLAELVPLSDVRRIKASVSQHRKAYKSLKRAFPNIWMQGCVELEMVDFADLLSPNGHPKKRETISAMLDWQGTSLTLYPMLVLVHSHVLVDCASHDMESIRTWFAERYDAPRQAYCKRIRAGQSLQDLTWKLGSYPFKDRVQFNTSFATDGYACGRYFSDKHLAQLVIAYSRLGSNGFKSLLIGSKPRLRTAAATAQA